MIQSPSLMLTKRSTTELVLLLNFVLNLGLTSYTSWPQIFVIQEVLKTTIQLP